jgi:hypothetical protein
MIKFPSPTSKTSIFQSYRPQLCAKIITLFQSSPLLCTLSFPAMPPKTAAAVDSLDAASVKFILSALKSCSEFAPDWNAVAKEHDIKYAKNA